MPPDKIEYDVPFKVSALQLSMLRECEALSMTFAWRIDDQGQAWVKLWMTSQENVMRKLLLKWAKN